MHPKNALICSAIIVPVSLLAESRLIFFDDFNSSDSFHLELTPNSTNKVYKTNSLKEGHLPKKWNYSWDYQYLEGDWKQAFYVVAPGETHMTQAGRSGSYFGEDPYRITADVELPETATRYTIELKQYKHDNDPIYYVLGADENGRDGVEIGYENQLPGTDETVSDAYLRGTLCEGLVLEDRAYWREWTDVRIEVDVSNKRIAWYMGGDQVIDAYARDLKPGGYFGIYMHYERGTKFDDVKITVLEGRAD